MRQDRIEAAFGGYIRIELAGAKRELVHVSQISTVRNRREGGAAIVLADGAVLLVSVDTADVIEVMRQASVQIGGSHAATA